MATFDNEESARRHQAQRMISFLNYSEDVLRSGPKDEVRDFFVKTAEGWLLRDWKDAEKAVEPYLDGEFIERHMIWTLRQIPVQTSHPLPDLTQANDVDAEKGTKPRASPHWPFRICLTLSPRFLEWLVFFVFYVFSIGCFVYFLFNWQF